MRLLPSLTGLVVLSLTACADPDPQSTVTETNSSEIDSCYLPPAHLEPGLLQGISVGTQYAWGEKQPMFQVQDVVHGEGGYTFTEVPEDYFITATLYDTYGQPTVVIRHGHCLYTTVGATADSTNSTSSRQAAAIESLQLALSRAGLKVTGFGTWSVPLQMAQSTSVSTIGFTVCGDGRQGALQVVDAGAQHSWAVVWIGPAEEMLAFQEGVQQVLDSRRNDTL